MVPPQDFAHPFLPQTNAEIVAMLKSISFSSVEDLFSGIPKELRFKGNLDLPDSHSEQATLKKITCILKNNHTPENILSFLGAGIYPHFIPSVVPSLANRSEFITSYTPYAPEISQGMLQALWEYQSMIAELTQLDLVNSSMYDLATALGESALMATRVTRHNVFLVPEFLQPERWNTLLTYATGANIKIKTYPYESQTGQADLSKLENIVKENKDDLSGIYIENPNFWGIIEQDIQDIGELAHNQDAVFVNGFDPISLGILKSPGELGADIAIGEGQALGLPMSFGGPLLGLFAVRNNNKLMRAMPGRIIGLTTEMGSSSRAFTMTLQTREQHIRRERATSNICTNNALCALTSLIYLSLLGPTGLKETAQSCLAKAHYLAEQLNNIEEIKAPHFTGPFFKEFVFSFNPEIDQKKFDRFMRSKEIIPGFPLASSFSSLETGYLTAVTETKTISELDYFVQSVKEFLQIQGGN
jgi:glycine dehydrogenase subunit 1